LGFAAHHVDKRAIDVSKVVKTFVLSSRVKTPTGNVFGQGFPVGYAVDGVETPEIEVVAGQVYRFNVLSACNHPFYLTTDSRGKGRAPLETGFDVPPAKSNPLICANASILWQPDLSLVGKDIWYQCTIHDNMGWLVKVKKETFCEKYARQNAGIFKNSKELVGAIVDGTVGKLVGNGSLTLEYFDGTIPTGSTNFLAPQNAAALGALKDSLVNFFGAALGCSDGSIPAYTGGDMKEVHKNMPISGVEYDFFNAQLLSVVQSIVDAADRVFLLDLLNSAGVRGAICNFGDGCVPNSLCVKYAKALGISQSALMGAVVDAAFAPVLAATEQKPFFDGTRPFGSINYFASQNSARLATLKANFAAFLGRADVLQCTDPQFPVARSDVASMKPVHHLMPITSALFDQFNSLVITGLRTLNITEADLTTIRGVLNSTESLICNQPGCSTIPASVTKAFAITVGPKAAGHHYFNQGFPAAFRVDALTVEGITLEVGKTYVFKAGQACTHPFYFSNGTGAGTPDFENGIPAADIGQPFCNGRRFTITPQAADVGKNLFFACKNHNLMGGRLCIVSAGQGAAACPLSGIVAAPATPCDELVANVKKAFNNTANAANFDNANKTLASVVVSLFVAGAGSATAPLRQYFNGTKPAGSRNFFGNDSATTQGKLVFDLVKYFGARLGCSDNSIQPYASPADEPNMKTVHQFMDISAAEFDIFNTVLVDEIQNFGTLTNTVSPATANTIRVFLNTTSTDICAGCGNFQKVSICEKWAVRAKVTQFELLQGAVLAVFGNLTASTSPALDYFNGKVPCESRDFVVDKLNQAGLAKSLIAFFGQPGVLGCSDPNFPKYVGATDMEELHKEMPITKALFDQFLNALADHATKNLATVVPDLNDDLAAIVALFNSDGVAKICNQDGCPKKGKFVPKTCVTVAPATTTTTATTTTATTTTGTTTTAPSTTTTEGTTTEATTTEGTTTEATTEGLTTTEVVGPTTASAALVTCASVVPIIMALATSM
jgi:hypothetical protein